jgi:NADPH-dependent 2,4-dienoyl-CoA reductase/sulfur reductase-like enzyme
MTCLANPAVGKEKEFEITPAEISRRVLIIGAGPAGLEAAIVCKKRGHDVIVAEKEKQLGGQLNYACKPPKKQDMEKLLYFLSGQIDKLKIQTHLGKKVTKRFIQEVKPDIVILATGSTPIVPEIPGTQSENVALATEILKGKEILGEKVIVVGGGQVGLETADFLSEAGRKVTVVEMSSQVGVGIPPRIMAFLMKRISAQNIRILVNRQVKEITSRGVRAAYLGQTEEITGDSVVLAVGNKSDISLLKELEDRIPGLGGLYVIGDCLEPRTALEAIHEAAQISKGI